MQKILLAQSFLFYQCVCNL